MKIPSLEEAGCFLSEAENLNPGPWVSHSRFTAQAAQIIAQRCKSLDPEAAYILGYLHDVGRREGVTDMRHVLDGYHYLSVQGYEDAARISMTHSFPIQGMETCAGQWDCTVEEQQFIRDYLHHVEFTDYDRLIQLCDCLALPSGFCLIEKRFVDVSLRRGVNDYTQRRWKAYLQLQRYFEGLMQCSVYRLLPGVVENTFGSPVG